VVGTRKKNKNKLNAKKKNTMLVTTKKNKLYD